MKNHAKRDSISSNKIISKELCEKRIFDRFQGLNDEHTFHNYFCSYDFHYHEEDLLQFWRDVIIFLYEGVFESFAINANEILEKTKLKNRRPIGLPNIIMELINRGDFVLSTSLDSEEYFKKNYKSLFTKETWGSWFKKGVVKTIKLPLGIFKSNSTSTSKFKQDELLINRRSLHHHLESIINLLTKILIEDDIEVFTKFGLVEILSDSHLTFKNMYLDLCLDYLQKIKKIEIFKVKVENTEIECIKLLRDENSEVNEKDRAIINILEQLKKFDKKIDETSDIVQDCLTKAKIYLKSKNRDAALNCMKKKNLYLKAYNHYSNLKITLEQNLIDIKSMQSNQNMKNILESVVKTSQDLKLNVNEFDIVADKLKDHKENLSDAKNLFNDYYQENSNEDSIDAELLILTEQIKKDGEAKEIINDNVFFEDIVMPEPSTNKIKKEKPHNYKLNDSLEEMLEELNR